MTERIERGVWPHPPLRYSVVVHVLAELLKSEKWFPREWQPALPGEPIYEGGVIERQTTSRYIYRSQRHQAQNPIILAEEFEKVFTTAERAAAYYLKWNLDLPGDLDGWKVIK